jgi:hypothetical protein
MYQEKCAIMITQQVSFMIFCANRNAIECSCLELLLYEVYIYTSYDDDISKTLRKVLEACIQPLNMKKHVLETSWYEKDMFLIL